VQCKECYTTRLRKDVSAFNAVMNDYRQQAKRRGLLWSLTSEEARKLFEAPCVFCGRPPVQRKKIPSGRGHFYFNGIDRVDNSTGYVLPNCVTCCWMCNWMKRDLSTSEFLEHVRLICHHSNPDMREPLTSGHDSGIVVKAEEDGDKNIQLTYDSE
jgi:hypothetical protein